MAGNGDDADVGADASSVALAYAAVASESWDAVQHFHCESN